VKLFIWMVIGSVAIGIGLSEARVGSPVAPAESECLEWKSIISQNQKRTGQFLPGFSYAVPFFSDTLGRTETSAMKISSSMVLMT